MPETKALEVDRGKPVNILDPTLPEGLEQELNPEADAWGPIEPPPMGCYPLQLMLAATDPWTLRTRRGMPKEDPKAAYYNVALECRITEGGYKNVPVYAGGSTILARGREISTIGGLVRKAGYKLRPKLTDRAQAKLFAEILTKTIILWADCDWEAWSRSEGRAIKKGMINFPEDPEGGYTFVILDKDGNECPARLRVRRWYGVKEEHPPLGAAPAVQEEEEVMEVATKAAVAPKPVAAPKEEEDLILDD